MSDVSEWHRWFAWWPVTVDAYHMNEIDQHGRMRYRKWLCWVERRYHQWIDPDFSDDFQAAWKYRLPRKA